MRSKEANPIRIIAGPCSINPENIEQLYKIAGITYLTDSKPKGGIAGLRVVGLKSRSTFQSESSHIGIDWEVCLQNLSKLKKGNIEELEIPPSVKIAQEVVEQTGLLVATEIMMPHIQIPPFQNKIPEQKLLLWNPSVNQLGWHTLQIAQYAQVNNWFVGLKNPKWSEGAEKVWQGLNSYSHYFAPQTILIHRGFSCPEKKQWRSCPNHDLAAKVKKTTGMPLFFDPSHSFGSKLRDQIVPGTIEAMKKRIGENFLYDGILIEAGTSTTDSNQHITISELKQLVQQLASFRQISNSFYE